MIVEEIAAKFGLEVDEAAFAKAEHAIHGLTSGVLGIFAAAGAAIVGIGALVEGTAEAGVQAKITAEKLGITTEALQGLQFAAKLSDVPIESFNMGLKFLSKNAQAAADGSGEMRTAFARAGVTVKDAAGKFKSPDQILEGLSDKFAGMPPGVKKTALAIQLFGRAGIEMIPLLNKGSAGIEEMRQKAEDLGLIMSEQTIKDSEAYNEALKELQGAFVGVRNAIGGPLIHYFTEVMKLLGGFVARNREIIAAPIIGFFEALATAVRFLTGDTKAAHVLWVALGAILGAAMLQKIFVLINGMRALSAASTLAAIKSAAAWALAALPFVLLGAAIALIADDLYQFSHGGKSVLGDIINWANNPAFEDNALLNFFKKAIAFITDFGDPKKWLGLLASLQTLNLEASKMITDFFEYNASDSPLVAGLKLVIVLATKLFSMVAGSQINALMGLGSAVGLGPKARDQGASEDPNNGLSQEAADQIRARGYAARHLGQQGAPGTTPASNPYTPSISGDSGATNLGPVQHLTQHITVHAKTDASPAQIAEAIQTQAREAHAAVR